MKPADFANSYKCYQDVLGAPDADLAKLLRLGCGGQPVAMFEDAMLLALGRFFRYVTGVPFVRAYEDGKRPDEVEGARNGQYGTIHLLSVASAGQAPMRQLNDVTIAGDLQRDYCESISRLGRYSFQLDVYRDNGGKTDQEQGDAIRTPVGSAFDVLQRLKARIPHSVHRKALAQYSLRYDDHAIERILNMPPEKVEENYESRATTTFELFACSSSQMRQPVIGENMFVEFDFDCVADLSALETTPEPEIIC